MKCKKLYFSALFLLATIPLHAQFYNSGQLPGSIQWKLLKTQHFRIIYPEENYFVANQTANYLEYYRDSVSAGFTRKPGNIPVLLINSNVRSNGFVSWAPRRMEWYTTPPRENYSQKWIQQLAIHEQRHAVQLTNLNQGFTRVLSFFLGQAAAGSVTGFIPLWYIEGDAVYAETTFSNSGRGRLADFDRELRALELDSKTRLSYDQSYLGSYKYFVPDHYKYGYQTVSYLKLKYKSKSSKELIEDVGRRPYLLAPFYFALKDRGIQSKEDLYIRTFDSLNYLWNKSLVNDTLSKTLINSNSKYTNYLYPKFYKESIFAVKTSMDDISRFILISDSIETIIHTPGRYYNTPVDISMSYLVWEEITPHPVWELKNYSVLKLLNLNTGKVISLTHKSRNFSPSFAPSGQKISCINIDELNRPSVEILAIPSGKMLQRISLEKLDEIYSPVWIDEQTLAFIALINNSKRIFKLNLSNDSLFEVFNAGSVNIEHLHAYNEKLYFTYEHDMAANICMIRLNNRNNIFRITNSRHGADYAAVNDSLLLYSDYSVNGYRIHTIELKFQNYSELNIKDDYRRAWITDISPDIKSEEIPDSLYSANTYSRFRNLFNVHSWAPFYIDPDEIVLGRPVIHPGIMLLSQNILSTVTSTLGYYIENQIQHIAPKFTFEIWPPVIEISGLFTNDYRQISWSDTITNPRNIRKYYSLNFGISLPLKFNYGEYTRFVKPEIRYGYFNYNYAVNNSLYHGLDLLELRLYAYNFHKMAFRDLQPRLGQSIYLSYYQSIVSQQVTNSCLTLISGSYFPGFFKHHGFYLRLVYEQFQDGQKHILFSHSLQPRGYKALSYSNLLNASIEYSFPFLYPDLSIGPVIYLKRLHATLYSDYAIAFNNQQLEQLNSFGIILSGEINLMRFFIPITPNLRVSYLPDEERMDIGFDVNINIPF